MIRFFSALFILFLMVGCTASRQFTNKQYRFEKDKVRIVVFPLKKDLIEIGDRAITAKLTQNDHREPAAVIVDSSYNHLVLGIRDTIRRARLVTISDSIRHDVWQDTSNFFSFEKKVGRDSIRHIFVVPTKEFIRSIDTTITVLFLINRIRFNRGNLAYGGGASPGAGGMMTFHGGSLNYLGAEVEYLAWDYEGNQAVACGDFSAGEATLIMLTAKTWKNLFKSIGKNLAGFTPFR